MVFLLWISRKYNLGSKTYGEAVLKNPPVPTLYDQVLGIILE